MKANDIVTMTYCGRTLLAWIMKVSPNGRSLMLGFDDALTADNGGMFFGAMPVLLHDDDVYRDIVLGNTVGIEPTTETPNA